MGMRAEHLKRWIATARKAEKYRETAVGKEEAETTTERARTGMSEAQNGTELDNWTRVLDLVR